MHETDAEWLSVKGAPAAHHRGQFCAENPARHAAQRDGVLQRMGVIVIEVDSGSLGPAHRRCPGTRELRAPFVICKMTTELPMTSDYPKPPFPAQKQPMPGSTNAMQPRPDHGETSYKGSGRLAGMKAIITGGDSGIGRAVAIAYAREGADVLISFLNETDEANEVKRLVQQEGRKAVLVPGDLQDPRHCREVIKKAVDELGGIDILVNNAAHQATFKDI